jgi:hypothetical protein
MGDMTQNVHPDQPADNWGNFNRRITGEEEVGQMIPEFSFQDPVAVGMMFCKALDDPKENFVALSRLATPESLPAFGDFTEAAELIASTQDVGYGSRAERAVGDDNVAYFKILSGITQSFQMLEEQILTGLGVVTLVWRAEFGEWRVHGIGDYLRAEEVPH